MRTILVSVLRALALFVSLGVIGLLIRKGLSKIRVRVPAIALLLALGATTAIIAQTAQLPLTAWISPLTQRDWLTASAAFMIFYGGAELSPRVFRWVLKAIVSLSTIGVVVSAAIVATAVFALGLGHLTALTALLLGAVLAGTDPAVLITLLDEIRIHERVREILIAESALNDPMSALIATGALTFLLPDHPPSLIADIGLQAAQAGLAFVIGWALGRLSRLWRRTGVGSSAVVRTVAFFALSFILAKLTTANPFLTAFVTGYLTQPLRSHSPQRRKSTKKRHLRLNDPFILSGILAVVRGYIFLLLGLTITLHGGPASILEAVLVAVILVVVARPVSVLISKVFAGSSLTWREAFFVSFNRQTGVIPALFASLLTEKRVPHADFIGLAVTASVVLTSVLLLPLFRPLAARFHLLEPDP